MSKNHSTNISDNEKVCIHLICFACRGKKPITSFDKCKASRTGFFSYCKSCKKSYRKKGKTWPSENIRQTKICKSCNEDKPLDDFYVAKLGRQGRAAKCKLCMKAFFEEYYSRPEIKEKVRQRCLDKYHKMTPDQKTAMMKKIRNRNARFPTHAINKNIKRALKRWPTETPATIAELLQMWHNQDGKCAVSGLVMTWGQGVYNPTSLSIDRIDCKKGYTLSNIRLVCLQVNYFRGQWSDEEMLTMAKAIIANMEAKKVAV